MDAITLASLLATCAPLIHPTTASALIQVESAFNPLAIGVVGASHEQQPRSAREALATATALQTAGHNFSLGLAQINVRNLPRLEMTIADALDGCRNVSAMQTILGECFDRAGGDSDPQRNLRRALSCYYSGDFATGFRHGYVNRVIAAERELAAVRGPPR